MNKQPQVQYRIQNLVSMGFDFNTIDPDKQGSIRKSTDLDFTLAEIAGFLQKETNNFTIINPICMELDSAVDKSVTEWYKLQRQPRPDEKQPEPAPTAQEEVTKEQVQDSIDGLEIQLEMSSNKKEKQELKDSIEGLKIQLEFL